MIRIQEPHLRRFVVACALLGLAVASGCNSNPQDAPDAPPSRLTKRLQVLQEKKAKTEAAK